MIKLKTAIPGPRSLALMQERQQSVSRGPFHSSPVFVARAQGTTVVDVDGNELLDFAAGIGVCNVGHNHPAVVKAIQRQSENYLHTSFNVVPYEGYLQLAEKLNRLTPGQFAKKSFLANSGAEAVENAIKFARAYSKRPAIVCFDQGFHGRTYMAMTLTAKSKPYKFGFDPFCPEVYRSPFPDAHRVDVKKCFDQFVKLVESNIGAEKVAAVIFEPVLGEGGFMPFPREFAQKLRQYTSDKGIVLIADEIQSGFGRTGTLFACEQLGIEPDLITTAKGLGGGLPISAVTGRAEIMDAPEIGGVGGTFGGNPLSCAAALAVCELFENPDSGILKNSQLLGQRLRERLLGWQSDYPQIGIVRGMGPMQAIEFVTDRESLTPDPVPNKALIQYAYQNGVIVMGAGTYGNVLRFLMPLTTTLEQLECGLGVLAEGLKKVTSLQRS